MDALARTPRAAVLSHTSAARVWRMPLPHGQDDRLQVTVPRSCRRWAPTLAQVHRRTLHEADVALVEGVRVTSPARTLVDLASCLPMADAVAAADHSVREGLLSLAALDDRVRATRGPGSLKPRCLVALCDPAAESAIESLLRVELRLGGLPLPDLQLQIPTPAGIVRVDFGWPRARLVVEVDGFAFHSDRAAYRRDRERGNALQLLGWRVLRFTWEQVVGRASWVVAQIAAALAA